MPNMSYCRFHNTLLDLRACYKSLNEEDQLSEEEEAAKRKLIDLCIEIALDYGSDIGRPLEEV